jgi:hypothetical protein
MEDRRDVMRQIVVLSESALSCPSGSVAEEKTEAVFVMVPAEPGVTTMAIEAVPPVPIVSKLHVTVPPDSPQLPCVGVAEMKVTLGGS